MNSIDLFKLRQGIKTQQGLESYRSVDAKRPDQSNESGGKSFSEMVKEGVSSVNKQQSVADAMTSDLASGKQDNIHETMLAVAQAELSFKLMVQVRNKALEAYQEVMRMPV